MDLTEAEKLSLLMLADIHEALGIHTGNEIDSTFVREAIQSGNAWALSQRYGGYAYARHDHSKSEVDHVYEVLAMWRDLEESAAQLDAQERKRVEEENHGPLRIRGFDGHEDQLGIVQFIIRQMDGFESLKGRADIDCHFPVEATYARMLAAYKPIRDRIARERPGDSFLTADGILEVLKARRYPEG